MPGKEKSMNTKLLRMTFERARVENGGLTHLGKSFYSRLFAKYPAVRPLFTTPAEEQRKKLMASIGAIVAAVENVNILVPYLHAMGIRHLAYKTEASHYGAVGENLVAVLGEHLSKEGEWTQAMADTWTEPLETVESIMIEAANNPKAYEDELRGAGFDADGFIRGNDEPWKLAEFAGTTK